VCCPLSPLLFAFLFLRVSLFFPLFPLLFFCFWLPFSPRFFSSLCSGLFFTGFSSVFLGFLLCFLLFSLGSACIKLHWFFCFSPSLPPRIIPTLALVKIRSYKKKISIYFFLFLILILVNKLKKNMFFSKTCKIFISIISIFYFLFFCFFVLGAGPSSAHVGARLDPASPAWPLAQTSGPAGQKKKKHAWSKFTRAWIVWR